MDQRPQDEIDWIALLSALKRNRLFMAGIVAVSLGFGGVYLLMTPPEYYSQTVFLLKKGDDAKGDGGLLSRLGGVGQNMAALGIGGSGSAMQDRAEFILKSRELAETVIAAKDLLPRLFPERWDVAGSKWKDPRTAPDVKQGVALLAKAQTVTVKKGFFTLGYMVKRDPELARYLAEEFRSALNVRIQQDAKNESEENRKYLEHAISNTLDPTVIEKIQNRIAFEIEKYMLVSTNSLDVLERAVAADQKSKPKKKLVLMLSFLLGSLAALGLTAAREAYRNARARHPSLSGKAGKT